MKEQYVLLRDREIRSALHLQLASQFSESLILNEFGCKGTNSRVDIAVVNCKLHGFEIKSDLDNLDRLSTQAPDYSSIFDFMTIVLGARHLKKAETAVPAWWGIFEARNKGGRICLKIIRTAKQNNSQSPLALSKMLWRNEAYKLLRSRGVTGIQKATAATLWREIAISIPVVEIAGHVRESIKARGAFVFDKRHIPSDDLSSIGSNSERYQKNLDWLLSLQTHDPHR